MKNAVYETETTETGRQQSATRSGTSKPGLDKEEMMKKMQAAGTPGPGHKALDALEGNWKAEVKCWMDPGGPAQVSHATSKAKWILGRRFLEEEFHGEMMGKPFTGRCLLGFDNTRQRYKSVWIDELNTCHPHESEGMGDNGNKVITLEGKADCPGTGQKDISMKQVFRVISPDKHVVEMFHDGTRRRWKSPTPGSKGDSNRRSPAKSTAAHAAAVYPEAE